MLRQFFHRLRYPRSLRWQFSLALWTQVILITAGSFTAVRGLYKLSHTARQMTEERLAQLEEAQDLARLTLRINLASHRLLNTDSSDTLQAGYLDIIQLLDQLDAAVLKLGKSLHSLPVLSLYKSGQLFRNTVHIVTELHRNILGGNPVSSGPQETLGRFHGELEVQALSLADSARDVSTRFTLDYRENMGQLMAASKEQGRRALTLLTGSVLLAWLISGVFLGRVVVGRLEEISASLRFEKTDTGRRPIPVKGDDEIGRMARAVEQFLEAHQLLLETQQRLRQSENTLQAIVNAAPIAILGLDPDGNVQTVWNRKAEQLLGWSAREVMGRPLSTVSAGSEEEFEGFREQIRQGMTLNGVEVLRQRRDGTPIHYSIYASPLYDANGCIIGNIAALVDIEERRQMEHALKLTRFSIDHALQAIYWIAPDGRFIDVNETASAMLGYSRSELLAMGIPDIDPKFPMEIWPVFWEKTRENKTAAFEATCRCKDGTIFPVEVAANYIEFEGREYNCAFVRDITEKKQAEAVLRFEQEQLLAIFDCMEQLVYVTDPRTHEILYINRTAEKAFGKSLTGKVCYRAMQGADAPCSFCTNEIILKQKPAAYRWEHYNPVLKRYFDVTDSIIRWPDSRDVRLEFAHDITDRKLLDDQLQKRKEDLERSNAELDDFAYIVSHDLKEPLRSIHSFSSFLLEDYRDRLETEGQAHLNIVKQSATRMEALLNDLLIYSRVGRSDLAMKPTDLSRVVAGVLEDMQFLLKEQNAQVLVAKDLPTVICDHVRVGEIFRNLIQNAVKYNDEKEKNIEVGRVPAENPEKDIPVFFVRDNGIGIREQHLDSIFKIFKRLHGRDKYGGGTGSGLTIARKIVERHGGRIYVESEFGRGSTFYFTLVMDNKES